MKTVFFDLSAAQPLRGSVHGGGEYARSVLTSLISEGYGDRLILLVDRNRMVPADINRLLEGQGASRLEFGSRDELQSILRSGKATRFFSALPYDCGTLDLQGLDVIFTIHGLRPVELPADTFEFMYTKRMSEVGKWLVKHLLRAPYRTLYRRKFQALLSTNAERTRIVVPSEHTRAAIETHLNVPASVSISVLYSPITAVIDNPGGEGNVLDDFNLTDRGYLLIVSGNRWIKNAYRALTAIRDLQADSEPLRKFDIVVTGGLPARMKTSALSNLKVLPYVEHEQLRALYSHAFALVYPTLNEGFGYPPIEAMACGTPVISSDVCSIPEIAGDAPLYFSPRDIQDMSSKIRALIENSDLWRRHQQLGVQRFERVATRQRDDLKQLCKLIVGDQ